MLGVTQFPPRLCALQLALHMASLWAHFPISSLWLLHQPFRQSAVWRLSWYQHCIVPHLHGKLWGR